MSTARMGGCAVIAVVLALWTAARADDGDSPPADPQQDKISRLEALIEAQQKKIEALEQKVSAAEQADQDQQRAEAMRAQIREILSEQEFREKLMPSTLQAGYDNGFYIRSSDDKFMLKFNGVLQFRWTYYNTRNTNRYTMPETLRDDRTGLDVARVRLMFSGNLHGKDLTYLINIRADSGDQNDVYLHEAWVNYRFADPLQFKVGHFRIATTPTQFRPDYLQQFVDRPMVDAVFGMGFGTGMRLWGKLFEKRLEYYLDAVNSLEDDGRHANGRVISPDPADLDNNPAIVFRTVWHALYEKLGEDMVDEGDLMIHQRPAWDFGFHYAFNDDKYDATTTRLVFPRQTYLPGGFGLTNSNGTQLNQFGFDTQFKYMGLSLSGQYIIRLIDPRHAGGQPYSQWYLFTGDGSTTAQQGGLAQVGYFLPIPGLEKKIELVGRFDLVSALAESNEIAYEYAAGVNYYIVGEKVKLQTDVTYITEVPLSNGSSSLATVNDNALVYRVQLQVLF